jgi:cell division protein FtsX
MAIEKLTKNAQAIAAMAFVLGIVLIMLGKFQLVDGITTAANTAVGKFVTGLDDYADWVGILVLIGVGAYLLSTFKGGEMTE